MVFNATSNNILVISWRSVLLVEQTRENHRPAASHWQTLSYKVVSLLPINFSFYFLQSTVFALIFLAKPKSQMLKKKSIYSNKFCHNFHMSESSFTCPGLRASGLARRLKQLYIFAHQGFPSTSLPHYPWPC
jgi:hypothetical protein